MKIPKGSFFGLYSLGLHLLVFGIFAFFWSKPLEVVDSQLKPDSIKLTALITPQEDEVPPKAEVPDTSKPKPLSQKIKSKKKKAPPPPKNAAPADTTPQLAFDTSGNCSECLAQPPFPEPEFFAQLGVDSSFAEVLVKIDTSGQVVEVYDKSFVEEGIKSKDHQGDGPVKLYDAEIQRGSEFWANTYETALKWNFYRAARYAKPKISESELRSLYPPGKWILQRVRFKNPKSKT